MKKEKRDFEEFKKHADATFGKADKKTLAFRKKCKELGADVVFRQGEVTDEQIIEILNADKGI